MEVMMHPVSKRFTELQVGDRLTAVAEITDTLADSKHSPPEWFRYTLYDGTASVVIFARDWFEVGDAVEIQVEVYQGKAYLQKPQLAFKLHSIKKLSETDARQADLKKLGDRVILKKTVL